MRRYCTYILFLLLPAITSAQVKSVAAGDSTNLALSATVTTSFISAWETLTAVRDGIDPAGSGDYSHGAYGNWNGEADYNKYNWVQYEWTLAQNITSSSVYWWDDGQGIDQPTDAYLSWWNGSAWIDQGTIGTALDMYNAKKLDIRTSKIRINMKSAMATGILEWRVYGVANISCSQSSLYPRLQIGNGPLQSTNIANLVAGDSLLLEFLPIEGGDWSWSGPEGFIATTSSVKLRNMQPRQSGTYTAMYLNECGAWTTRYFNVTVRSSANIDDPYVWPSYNPTITYNFRDEFPALAEPSMELEDCAGVVGKQSSGWWTFRWGATANPLVTAASITPMLERMNKDFAYFRDVMGWPPDKRAKNGYRSAIYLYGSGLCTDNASNTALGGWQSSITYGGESWPMVLISYYPIYCFDPSCTYGDKTGQMGAVVHEGIHSVLADLPGCKNAAWFHEGGNTWLQQEATATQTGNYSSMGFLNGASFVAPFMPIECYSGWLQDDSFGGPSAEGVNVYDGTTQLCTWRNLLGGVQYSNTFPTFLGMTLGNGSIPWIWRYCPTRVLEGMSAQMGDSQMRRLIMEYRAKQALVDMGNWTGAVRALLDGQFGTVIKAEWEPSWMNPATWNATPYAKTTNNGSGLLTPESRTTPGWSGANQIPLKVTGDVVTVNFQPLSPNMSCQLCYRTASGQTVYSNPVFGGDCSLRLEQPPANNVIFAVICNTDYIYQGEVTRKAHFDYRLQFVTGVTEAANINTKWYQWDKNLTSSTGIEKPPSGPVTDIYPNPVTMGNDLNVRFGTPPSEPVWLEIWSIEGIIIYSEKLSGDSSLNLSGKMSPGVYFAVFRAKEGRTIHKIIVN